MSDDDLRFESSADLADLLEQELGDNARPATKGDIARLHAAQLRLFDFCISIRVESNLAISAETRLRASAASNRLSTKFIERTRTAIKKLNDDSKDGA